jgi:riboflavin kinase
LDTLTLSGTIASGQGNGKKYLQLSWVEKQIQEKLGYTAYPGTLNIKLNKESTILKYQLKKAPAIQICPVQVTASAQSIKQPLRA